MQKLQIISKRIILIAAFLTTWGIAASAQQLDTTGIYGERRDSLEAAVLTARNAGNYLSRGKDLRTEIISSSGLIKMACCNVAESFENSASVTVGYSDATTGARQIRLLGLAGTYTQMLDENRPIMRGISAPFGLSYLPGPWLESIQIAKGSPSVINGTEQITGAINVEHQKPTDGRPLFLNASIMNDTKADFNITSTIQVTDQLSTILMGHVDGNFKTFDHNGDGFADDPSMLQFNLGNRWLWHSPALQAHWGVRAIRDRRRGGQIAGPWTSEVVNSSLNAFFKLGHALNEDGSASIAVVGDYSFQKMTSHFGNNLYDAIQHSAFANLIYRNQFNDSHDLTVGVNATLDFITEDILVAAGQRRVQDLHTRLMQIAPYAEYTFKVEDTFSMIAALSASVQPGYGVFPVPRLTLKYQPVEALVLRANGGRGLRHAHPIVDNIGILSTGKTLSGDLTARELEDAWTFGGNATLYFGENAYLSLDYFRTQFVRQLLLDREAADAISFYTLDGHPSWSDNIQLDFSIEPVEKLTLTLTGRYTNARAWHPSGEVRELALTSRYKAVFNAQYILGPSRWIFDFTASLNGPARVYDFMRELRDEKGALLYPEGQTPVYPQIYAQITRRFRGFDIYVGGENLTGFMQSNPVIQADQPFSSAFDAASVWGPLMGAKIYAGFRVTIWEQQ